MKKKLVLGIIVIVVILSTSIFRIQPIFASNYTYQLTNPAIRSLVPLDPIVIVNDDNFTDYGFLGSGTSEEPYLIENYEIITSSDTGIYITGTTKHFVIRNCYVHAYWDGIVIEYAAEGTVSISNTTCSNNRGDGIRVFYSNNATLTNNICNNNYYWRSKGISLSHSSGSTVINNTCNINYYYGIFVRYSPETVLINNTCQANHWGIFLEYSFGASIINSIFTNNYYVGISIMDSSEIIVTNNNCSNNGYTGLAITSSPEAVIINNVCNNNYLSHGLSMYYSARATLINNTCNNNKYQGIFISGSAGSTLINNTIQNNGFYVSEDSIESYLNYTLENN
ncbi:MAG: right-handed parallel beta-helix repeat-containing protein, partial [Candidatus Heimdallarchaeota archaeon]|nr:right-handed parallel beta-helix repeat-containing protein [Candidatus Heimdallarchaeota archaeon]MCK4611196.1 right-handed parallel beta-helix repeat-containing protein [Candidatus Heimdallarchaeota archaeon]